ncbi:MAG TPA: 2-C-methyl-D-erythritol 4-phosphate cytidylyltransferase [Phycisphaerae bacterium]|jgi:2-C-methyl-D-erythritol 4-phosphate cytidylyltransferase|nr:2-C-methyl-D-erythritol 4-phosphate cytidylyltransferase [Phycisphaerae bacterium]
MPLAVIFPLVPPAFVAKTATRAFAKIDSREVFLRAVEVYTQRNVEQRIIVVTPDDLQVMQEKYAAHLGFQGVTVAGGASDWFGCVARGLEKLDEAVDTVIIHDPCCPAVSFYQLDALEEALGKEKSAVGIVPVLPTRTGFADLDARLISEFVDMSKVAEVQSPQIFRRKPLADAYAKRGANTFVDDAELMIASGHKIATIPGSRFNQRIDGDEMVRLGKDLLEHLPKPKPKTPLNPFGEAEW